MTEPSTAAGQAKRHIGLPLLWTMVTAPPVAGPAGLAFPPKPPKAGLKFTAWLVVLLGLFAAIWAETAAFAGFDERGPDAVPMAVAAVIVGATVLVARGPLLTWRIMVVALALLALFKPWQTTWPWSITALVLLAVVMFLLAERHPPWLLLGVWAVTTLVLALGGWRLPPVTLLALVLGFGVVLMMGYLRAQSKAAKGELSRTKQRLAAETAQTAVLAERARIARELHDVVAHRMSLISIQAEAAPLRLKELPPEAEAVFALIHAQARQALEETRHLVGLLRGNQPDAESLAPAPTASDVASLVAEARASGMTVSHLVTGTVRPVDAATGLAAYRVVQEALSNAARHAPGQPVTVELDYQTQALAVTVTNRPTPLQAGAR